VALFDADTETIELHAHLSGTEVNIDYVPFLLQMPFGPEQNRWLSQGCSCEQDEFSLANDAH